MVANFTLGKRRYAAYEDDLRRILTQAADLRARLVSLVDEDAAAFAPLAHAYGIPKGDPSRDEALEAAAKAACDAPLKTMEQVSPEPRRPRGGEPQRFREHPVPQGPRVRGGR